MKPVVAILSARPETIEDDYARLLELAGLGDKESAEGWLVAAEARRKTWIPGLVCPPWQLVSALGALGPDPDFMVIDDSGAVPFSDTRHWGWGEALERRPVHQMGNDRLQRAPYRPQSVLPALEGVLPDGCMVSPHLRDKKLLLLSGMSLAEGGTLMGNLGLLDSLLAPGRKSGGRIPKAEVLAEVVGLAKDIFPVLQVVTDVTVCSVMRRGGRRVFLTRNLLVAGNDPVAVDSVLAHLAGLQKQALPWLRLCEDRGLGVANPDRMRLVGETKWLDLDFRLPEDTFASGTGAARWNPGALWARWFDSSTSAKDQPGDSPWGSLFRQYQSGVTS